MHHPVPDELHDVIAHAALPLPPSLRNVFTMQVLTRLRACPAQEIGVGLAHRLAAEEQRSFLIESGSAGGRRQGQGRRGQIERRYPAIHAVLDFVREPLRRYHAAAVSRIANPQLATLRSRLVVSSARVVNYD